MTQTLQEYMWGILLLSGAILSVGALIFTILFTWIRRPRAYQFFRYSLTTVGFSLSTWMIFVWILLNTLFMGRLDANALRTVWTGIGIFLIPLILGVLAAFGPRFAFVKIAGRILVGAVTPIAIGFLCITNKFQNSNREEVFWFLLYAIVAALWWEGLIAWDRKVQKLQQLI